MPLPRKRRKPLAPATGMVKILRAVGTVNDCTGEIAISGKPYYLACHSTGFTLVGWDGDQQVTSYDLPLDLSSCD